MSSTPIEYVRLPDCDTTKGPHAAVAVVSNMDDVLLFDLSRASVRKSLKGMVVGQVYAIPTVGAGEGRRSLTFGAREWKGPHPDKELMAQWQAQQKAADLTRDAKRREATEATGTGGLEKALAPIARAYAALPYPHRPAFEVWVLSVLRRKS